MFWESFLSNQSKTIILLNNKGSIYFQIQFQKVKNIFSFIWVSFFLDQLLEDKVQKENNDAYLIAESNRNQRINKKSLLILQLNWNQTKNILWNKLFCSLVKVFNCFFFIFLKNFPLKREITNSTEAFWSSFSADISMLLK
jgi:hypothetical protein